MPKFAEISVAVLATDEKLAEYLKKGKIGKANKGGTFVGNYEVAPDEFRKYGIVLPKGGMILPDYDPETVTRMLVAVNENRQKLVDVGLQRKLDAWKRGVEEGIIPALQEKLIARIGNNRNVRVYASEVRNGFAYGSVPVDGLKDSCGSYAGSVLKYEDGVDLEKALANLERNLPQIAQRSRDEAFLASQAPRFAAFQVVIDRHAEFSVRWYDNKKNLIEVPGRNTWSKDAFFVYRRSGPYGDNDIRASYDENLVPTERTPEQLEALCTPLRSASDDRKRNEAKVAAIVGHVKGLDIILPDRDLEDYDSKFIVVLRDTFIEFTGKFFYWTDEGVVALETEVDSVSRESDALKSKIWELVESGKRIDRGTGYIKNDRYPWGHTYSVHHFNGELICDKALYFAEGVIREVENRKAYEALNVSIRIVCKDSNTKYDTVFEASGHPSSFLSNLIRGAASWDNRHRGYIISINDEIITSRHNLCADGSDVVARLRSYWPLAF